MQYTLINGVRNHPDSAYALPDVYSDYISDAVLAEELGFSTRGTASTTSGSASGQARR